MKPEVELDIERVLLGHSPLDVYYDCR